MRLGVFGGTFDPIHLGHLSIARNAFKQLSLDQILFVPAKAPQLREGKDPIGTPYQRYEMVRLAIDDIPEFFVSDIELRRPGPSYMVDTIKELSDCFSSTQIELYLILGSDLLDRFHQWHQYQVILEACTLAIYARPGYSTTVESSEIIGIGSLRMEVIEGPGFSYSGTKIRESLRNGALDVQGFLSEIGEYIEMENIYG